MDGTVLLADDDRTIRTVLTQALTRAGCKVHATGSMATLMRWVQEGKGDLVVSDVVMPDGNGLVQLPLIRDMRPHLPVIIISAQNTITTAIKANEGSAFDYLPKPFDLPDLLKRVAQGLAVKPVVTSRTQPQPVQMADLPMVGRAPVMQALFQLIAKVMNAPVPLLVTGDSGTGKTLISRSIHALSDRASEPIIIASDQDLETPRMVGELFNRGANSTIIIENIGDLPMASQRMLAQAIDGLSQDDSAPRIIATTRENLAQMVQDGTFRDDLYFQLEGVEINVPALVRRVEDIDILANHFRQKFGAGFTFSKDAALELKRRPWPGNVRQLENLIRRLALTQTNSVVTPDDLEPAVSDQLAQGAGRGISHGAKLSDSVAGHLQHYFDLHGDELPPQGLYPRILRELEIPLLEIAMDATGGNQAKCADLLGINRNTLRKKLTELDINVTRRRKLM